MRKILTKLKKTRARRILKLDKAITRTTLSKVSRKLDLNALVNHCKAFGEQTVHLTFTVGQSTDQKVRSSSVAYNILQTVKNYCFSRAIAIKLVYI